MSPVFKTFICRSTPRKVGETYRKSVGKTRKKSLDLRLLITKLITKVKVDEENDEPYGYY